ncbi:MAG: LPS export ABC transporter permease LptG [Rhodospirillaceae bacterium]|nr:LPS export ABC transporter permease LptG [Rhodospirillaceae bacterium]
MKISSTLSLYIGKNFLFTFLAFFAGLLSLVFILEMMELLRRAASKPEMTTGLVFHMALLKLPHMGQLIFPFSALFAGMTSFWKLSRSSELAVTRAAGISAWQFLVPVILAALLLGIFKVTALNPIAASTLSRFQQLESLHFKGQKSFLAISAGGLWLRQGDDISQAVIHADSILQQVDSATVYGVTVYLYGKDNSFTGRIDASEAKLEDGFWIIANAWVSEGEAPSYMVNEYKLASDLTLTKIQDNFAPPETMSFWDLPEFIKTLDKAGFSAIRHRLHWHSLLATPLLLCAMVLIAATFTLRHARKGTTYFIIGSGAMAGFLLYFFSDVVFALGLSESIPIVLAAWAPSGVAAMLGLAMMFHLEDG